MSTTPASHATIEGEALPQEAYAVALASVPGIGPKTLRVLLRDASPSVAWETVRAGRVPAALAQRFRPADAGAIDVASVWRAHVEQGVGVRVLGMPGYPDVLARDPEAPAAVFFIGSIDVLDAYPKVAIVGTRSATRYGLGVAAQLGAELAAAGVTIVSGLALGIDGAAHEGAVAAWTTGVSAQHADGSPRPAMGCAPPVAVVAGSVTVPYPRQHGGLWRRVAESGAVVSEAPIGAADLGWRFPMRNRIIAALSDVVVVVECHARGGSLHTVHAAAARGVPVGAVPGSVRSPASGGTNGLLADGCFVVRDTSDILVALSLERTSVQLGASDRFRGGTDTIAAPHDPACAAVLDALGWERCQVDDIVDRTALALDVVCRALESLRGAGIVHGHAGWWERA